MARSESVEKDNNDDGKEGQSPTQLNLSHTETLWDSELRRLSVCQSLKCLHWSFHGSVESVT